MSAVNALKGPRLEFVAKEFSDDWIRLVYKFNRKTKKNEPTEEKVTGGYMIYTPMGQSYRLTHEQAQTMGFLDREPVMIGLDRINDATTPMGRFKFARSDEARNKAYKEMESEVIKCCGDRRTLIEMMHEKGEYNGAS